MSASEPIRMACPQCGARFVVPPELMKRGPLGNCRQCGWALGSERQAARSGQPVSEDIILGWLSEETQDHPT